MKPSIGKLASSLLPRRHKNENSVETAWHFGLSRATGFSVVVLAVVLLLTALLANELRRSYDREIENAFNVTQSLSQVLDQQLLASIEKIDLIMREAEYQYSAYINQEGLAQEKMTPMLARSLARIPGVLSLRLVNDEGKYVFDASGNPSSANISDRNYFLAQKTGAAGGLYPEGPLFSRVVNMWTITFSRGVHDKHGRFRGIVQSSIKSDSLAAAFLGLSIGTSDSISLVNSNLILIARVPQASTQIGNVLGSRALADSIAANAVEGSYVGISSVDGQKRLYSYRRVGDFPFYIVVGRTYDSVLAEWRRTATVYAIITFFLLVSAILLVVRASRRFSETERIAEEQQRLTKAVFSNSMEGIVVTDSNKQVVAVNPAFTEITGHLSEDVIGKKFDFLRSDHHDEAFYNEMWHQVETLGHWRGEIWSCRKSGAAFPELLSISTSRNDRGEVSHYIGVFTDITERKAIEEQFRFLSEHDYLTGLPNRLWLHGNLPREMVSFELAGNGQLGILFLDLDRFKNVNDSLGHNIGDLVLKELANRMVTLIGSAGVVTRQGGDEFVVILTRSLSEEEISGYAQALLAETARLFHIEQHEISITGSIGIAKYASVTDDMLTLLKHADLALYEAKRAGRNRFAFYRPDMDDTLRSRMKIETDLRDAIQRKEFVLYYQPQVRATDCTVIGVEALLRWNHPVMGIQGPNSFLAVAEDTMQILPIGKWVLEEACRQAKAWLDAGFEIQTVAVNLSALQFRHQDILSLVEETLVSSGLPAHHLELEITESLMMDDTENMIGTLRSLKSLGVRLAIDDFGTGFSSLSYLERFAIDRIKIDKSFVDGLHRDSGDNTIARAIINIARVLNLEVVAEGVETETQYDYLRGNECDFIQGFLFARPMPAEQIKAYCQDSRARHSNVVDGVCQTGKW